MQGIQELRAKKTHHHKMLRYLLLEILTIVQCNTIAMKQKRLDVLGEEQSRTLRKSRLQGFVRIAPSVLLR
jgi:hypothetical protein